MERDSLLVLTADRRLELTESGRGLAVQVMRKHRLAERLLSDVIGLEWQYIHEEACRWEHVMSERVERRLIEILQSPVESPYGNPIPGLEQLGVVLPTDQPAPSRTTLRQAAEADPAGSTRALWTVKRLAESVQMEPEVLEQLLEAGLRPGGTLRLRGLNEAHVMLEVEDGTQAPFEVELPLEVAQHIFVAAAETR